jgi:hypothetical protein
MRSRKKPRTVTTRRPKPRLPGSLARVLHARLLMVLMGCGLWLLLGAADSAAQHHEKPYALIYGTVWGPDDLPLYGVHLKIRRADETKVRWELYSDHRGEFAQRVPPGPADYVVTADLKGYKYAGGKRLVSGEDVKVHIDNEEREDIGLHLK